jgi:hypothetical protein
MPGVSSTPGSRRAARLLLWLVLAALLADRTASAVRRGDRPVWRLDGDGEAALARGSDAWAVVPPLPIFVHRVAARLTNTPSAALVADRLTAIATVVAGLALLITAGERHVWRRPWASAAAGAALALTPAVRDWAANASGEGYGVAVLLIGAAVGTLEWAGTAAAAAFAVGLLASLASRLGPGAAFAPLAFGLGAGRGRSALRLAVAAGAGWIVGTGIHVVLLHGVLPWGEALTVRGAMAPFAASAAELGVPIVPLLCVGAWAAALQHETVRRRRMLAAVVTGVVAAAVRGTFLTVALACVAAVAGAADLLVSRMRDGVAGGSRGTRIEALAVVAWAAGAAYLGRLSLELDPSMRAARHSLQAIALLCAGTALLRLARLPPAGPRREAARNAGLAALATLAALLGLEMAFSHVARSHGFGYTLAARLWSRHLLPQNAAGFRDGEYTPERLAKPHPVAVVGDSFAEGGGVARVDDRFAAVLAARLPADHEVFVLAKGGADTVDERGYLEQFPGRPEVVVVSYYANDVERRARARRPAPAFTPYLDVPEPARELVRRSYLLNFAYWLLPHGDAEAYRTFLKDAFDDPVVLAAHLGDLDALDDLAGGRGARVVYVLFPFLDDVEGSAFYLERVEAHLRARGRTLLNVADLVRDMPRSRRVVNAQDAHPSPAVHRRVGEALYRILAATPGTPARALDAATHVLRSPSPSP